MKERKMSLPFQGFSEMAVEEEGMECQSFIGGGGSVPPKDILNAAYLIHFLLGASYLVPWNAFITAIDYFEYLYPDHQIDRVFAVVYIFPTALTLFAITIWGRKIRAQIRVNLGMVVFIAMLIVMPIMDNFFVSPAVGSRGSTYIVTIIAAGISGIADGFAQGSIVGSTGELPERYMQALMAGTAASGVLVSVLRIVTKGLMPQTADGLRSSANLYFITSAVIMLLSIVSYNTVDKLPVMQYYNHRLRHSRMKSVGVDIKPLRVEEESAIATSGKADVSISYKHVWGKIQGFALGIFFLYVVTLSIFPGHITEDLSSEFFGDWYAIILTACYNVFDLVGKVLPAVCMLENKYLAVGGCFARVVFYPLFYICLHGPAFFRTETVAMVLTSLLGLTNGYLTTVVMILAPKSVPLAEAEVAGFIMVIMLVVGLAAGSLLEWVWVL